MINWLIDKVGCSISAWTAKQGFAYRVYCALAGSLECLCCIFWRGLFIGAIIGIMFSIILSLIERFFL